MSQNLRSYLVAVFGMEAVIAAAPPESWDNPSPCEGWTARDVAGHAMGVIHNVAARAGVGDVIDPFATPGAIAGADVLASWRGVRNRLLEAVDRPGALQQEITSSFGTMNVDGFLAVMTGDAVIHTWDIARATGGNERLDPDLVIEVRKGLAARDEKLLRAPGRYAAPLTADASDAQTELLAFAGRRP
jgi:uncharacterized protein (TIGR03086 family)